MAEAGQARFGAEALRQWAYGLLRACAVPEADAAESADNLLFGNLRGVDSHGIRLLLFYLEHIRAGTIRLEATGEVLMRAGGVAAFDGQHQLGAATARRCVALALELAGEGGIGFVTARRTNHFGIAAYWARKIADQGMLGFAFCNASPIVAPWQAKESRYGTNPICCAVPGPYERSFLLDMATTTVAANRIFKAAMNHEPSIPLGWAMDKEGRPTTDPQEAYRGLIAPLGGYKGSGLAVMVEILTSVLAGGAMGTEVGGIRFTDKPVDVSHSFLAIDVRRFMPGEEFTARMERLVEMIHSAQPAAGYNEVLVAGEPELRTEAERRSQGIPMPEEDWQALAKVSRELGVDVPLPLES